MTRLDTTADQRSLAMSANELAQAAIRRFPQIDSIALFGSVARGDSSDNSDLDLLFVSERPAPKPSELVALAADRVADRVSAFSYTRERFEDLCRRGGLIVIHLKRDYVPLYDPTELFSHLLADAPTSLDADREDLATSLNIYRDLTRFNGSFLFCLSHLYVLGKRATMLALADRGAPEFNRDRIFDRARELFPHSIEALNRLERLRPFFELTSGYPSSALPFDYHYCEKEVALARESVRRVALIENHGGV